MTRRCHKHSGRLFKRIECDRAHQRTPITLRPVRVRRRTAWRAGGRRRSAA